MENVRFNELVGLMFSKAIRGTSNSSMIFFPGDYDKALICLKKAVQLNKDSKENSFIGLHYEQVKKYVEEKETD